MIPLIVYVPRKLPKMKRRIVLAAAVALLAGSLIAPGASAQQNETLTEQAKMEQIIHDYLLAHPEVVVQAVHRFLHPPIE